MIPVLTILSAMAIWHFIIVPLSEKFKRRKPPTSRAQALLDKWAPVLDYNKHGCLPVVESDREGLATTLEQQEKHVRRNKQIIYHTRKNYTS